ncbi:MAG: right-handed parallel beta-helix repeat-containing protein [Xanthomonadales bacterium]|nr:right-handed parallel beta-helix repeat-containing protein [Xanthomonadales bacterium]
MNRPVPTAHAAVPKPSLLALALGLAGIGAANADDISVVTVPREWPLPYERSAMTTPVRARMLAMQLHHPDHEVRAAGVRTVTTCADDGSPGSLRTLVDSAVSGDTIDLAHLACDRIVLDGSVLEVEATDLAFVGPGADALTIDGNRRSRVLRHASSGELRIENLTIAGGRFVAEGTDVGYGGCIAAGGSLTVSGSVVRDCTAIGVGAYGGAVFSGPLLMRNSTITGNTAFGDHPTNGTAAYGGGLFSYGIDIADSTISNNRAIGTHNPPLSHWEIGGGVFVARNGGIIERSTINNNYAMRFAGGLTQEGDLILRNATISGNRARDDDGGGVRVRQVTAIYIENSTITGNSAGTRGGGVSFTNNALQSLMSSSLIAGNASGTGDLDVESTMALELVGSHNLIGRHGPLLDVPPDTLSAEPRLLALAHNGGPTLTHALAADSPARDRGTNTQGLGTDQRGPGYARVVDAAADIGAYEVQGDPGPATAVPAGSGLVAVLLAVLLGAIGLYRLVPARRGG